jgi:hypothetical protein
MMTVINCVFWIALILYIGFDTNAVYQYLKKLPSLNFITHVVDYEKEQQNRNWQMSYSLYMQLNHGGFLMSLLTCRYCVGIWLSIIAALVTREYMMMPIMFFMSQLVYNLFRASDKFLTEMGDRDVG